ncbi:HAD-IIB family hydrolase [Alkalimarinus sediminis]|uniref:HAD-IIB family hydrolase n=1 Tax=Alkalimarinus sediminis TaxID=1632866 RepID=A0A9E8HIY8_9ALTE|nr:HAD-IIB family hydrolase [Alkalimarinus sediminis]UZW75525.1 HAD-IIB family hydrolase [Alkalimarinus sediminis]
MVHDEIVKEIKEQQLPQHYLTSVERYLVPLADKLAALTVRRNGALLVGVQGGQGTGKSTLALFMSLILQHNHNLRTVCLSLDDFYLTKSEREQLACDVHPLLKTRGVPGTHDIELALETITKLESMKEGEQLLIPRFDKALDDRKPQSEWDSVSGKVDVILFEGWCVAAPPEVDSLLKEPINKLETEHDEQGRWRNWVNEQLKQGYTTLFDQLDYLVVLQAPSFDVIYEWRLLQEHKLKASIANTQGDHSGVMDDEQIAYFIQHYERITRACLNRLPQRADCLFKLDETHAIYEVSQPRQSTSLMVVTDLDGTLLDHFDYSYDAATPAIELLKHHKIPLIINTSKTYEEVVGIKNELCLDTPCIVENGSAVYLSASAWPSLAGQLSDDLLLVGDQYVKIFGQPRTKILTTLQRLKSQSGYLFEGFSDYTEEALVKQTGLSQSRATQALNRHFSEPIIWQDSEAHYLQFEADIKQSGLMLLRGGRFIHVLGCCDKGQSLAWLKALYTRSNNSDFKRQSSTAEPLLVALGDSQNDAAMLAIADIAVVVKSPVHEYPTVPQPKGEVVYSQKEGPAGWNDEVLTIIKRTR